MAGPSNLLQALKEVKFAEKEQLDRAPQAEPPRITLFDLIAEKERRHKARSPPPVPPKPVHRLAAAVAAAEATSTTKSVQQSEQSVNNSVPNTIEDHKPSTLFQPTTPPSLPSPPRCAMLRKISGRDQNVSGTTVVIAKCLSEQESRKESTPPLISDNPFVRWDRLKTLPSNKPQQDISLSPQKSTKGDRPTPGTEGPASPGSSGAGTEAFDEDGFITASASATTPTSTSSSSSTTSVNSSSSPSMDWPHPDKITARPLSHQCSPDSFDDIHSRSKPNEVDGDLGEGGIIHDHSPVRVSLIAAPKKPLPALDNLPPETASDTTTITTSSSRASTIFSYPWDLPPPQTHHPSSSSSPPPPAPLKWATLQRHLSEMGHSPPPLPITKTLQQNGCDSEDVSERMCSVPSEEAIEGSRPLLVPGEREKEEKTYATIGDELGAHEKALERLPTTEVPSPNLQQISAAGSIELPQKEPVKQYVYAEVRPSPNASTSSSTKIRSPPVPAHPSKKKATPLSHEAHFYEVIKSNLTPSEAEEKSFEVHSPTSMSLTSTERPIPANRSSRSPSSVGEPGRHLEQFVSGLMNDKTSPFYKHMSAFIECTIKQLGQTPQKTLQNICQFINGVSNFLQKVHTTELRQAVEAEERDLRGLQYFDVAQELETLVQLTVLRPLHRRLIEDLQYHGCGTVSPQTAEEFTNLVKKAYQELPNLSQEDRQLLGRTLFQPVRRIFYQMQDAFQPGAKLDCLIRIFHTIDLQVPVPKNSIPGQSKDSCDIERLMLYATVLAMVDLLKPSRTLDVKDNSNASTGISRIEVQRLYLEAIISSARLASSAEGCKRLTDLVCLLRYVENFRHYASPAGVIRLLRRQNHQAAEIEANLATTWRPGLNKLRRSYTDNIQEALNRRNDHSMTLSLTSPPWQGRRVRKVGCVQSFEKTSAPSSPTVSSILVLAANESERLLVPFEIPLRQSLTVRELCNMLALKLQIFDSKEYALFYHSLSGDISLSDTLHLERFMTQSLDPSVQSVNCEMGAFFSSSNSIDFLANSQPTTQKKSTLRRFFQRRKRVASSDSLKSESPLPQQQHHRKSNGVIKRQPSIEWSTVDGGDTNFVLVYRRRSSEAVLYANDLFECFPSAGKLI
uniref:Protein Sprint n=1 Tax=Echinococcus granulosus TaxID=6210 RepID=A0A068WRI8_ECHGR|nr:Protein Sprint [Echinococcus granulosus]